MSNMDLDTIIKTYADSTEEARETSCDERTLEQRESMVSLLQASMIDQEELFPEKFADPYAFAEESLNEALENEISVSQPLNNLDLKNETFESESLENSDIETEVGDSDSGLVPEIELTSTPEVLEMISTEIQGRLEFNENSAFLEDQQLLEDIKNVPDRLAFKIGDVAEIVDVKQYVLRYWETEFEVLKPKKSRQNQRMYTRKDIENILLIKKLLYRDKFSIEGARRALKALKAQVKETKQWDQVADKYEHAIEQVRYLLDDIREVKSLFITKIK